MVVYNAYERLQVQRRCAIFAVVLLIRLMLMGALLGGYAFGMSPKPDSSGWELPVVRTWGDLMKQPSLDAGEGITVRLGISGTHAPRNYGVLVYCLTDGYDFLKLPKIARGWMGPLQMTVRRGGKTIVGADTNLFGLSYKGWNTTRSCTLLFAYPVLIDARGRYEITISDQSGRLLAHRVIAADKSFYHPWTPFLLEEDSEWERVPNTDWDFRQTKPAVLSVPGIGVAINGWSGYHFVVVSGHATVGYDFRGKDYTPPGLASPLPQLVPESPDPDLTVSCRGGMITLKSEKTEMECARPDLFLVARWWVNGKPFIPQPGRAPEFEGSIEGHSGHRLEFRLNLDPARLSAHSGDKVAVQLLLCDAWGYAENADPHMMDAFRDGKARLTKKVEFTIP